MKRRDFMIGTGAAGLVLASKPRTKAAGPTMLVPSAVKPLVISSANGNQFKNGGEVTCVQKAFTMITQGEDVLDSVIAGVNIVELDPLDDSVGYGGLPNAEGVVQLDSSCMHGPKKQAGAVASIEGVRTPSLVAKGRIGTDRSSPDSRQGRAGFCAQHGIQDRRRSEYPALARTVARVEAANRSFSLSRSEKEGRGGPARRGRNAGSRDCSEQKTSTARSIATASTAKAKSAA